MAAPKTSIAPKPRPRTKTKEKTLRGRPVWIDHTGEVTGKKGTKYSEITTTIPWGTEWITAPSVDENGKRLSDDEVKQRLLETRGKDFITGEELPTFSNPEKASKYAQWRSDTMFDQEAIEQGFPEEFPMGPEPKRKDFIDRSIDKGKDFLEYLTTPSKHGVFNKGGDVGLPSNRLVYDVDDITRRGPEGKIKRDAAKKRVLEKYNLEGARSDWKVSSSKLGTILANLPTNVRLLTEFMLGKDKPISINDFTKDELASIIALSEEQQENYKNVQNRKLKNQPENVTTVDGYDTTQPYRFSKWIENSPYFRTLAFTLTDPNYQTRTTLGRYDTEETPSSIIIKDAYDMNIKQRDLPNPFGGREELSKVLEEVRSNPEVAGEFLANIIKPNPEDSRKFDLVIPKRKPDQPSPRDTAYQAPMQLKEKPKDNPRIKEEVPEGFDILKFDKGGDVAAQMDLMLPSADEDTRSTKEFLQHPLETVPYFQRPMGSSTNDPQVGQDDAGNPVFKGRFGEYTVKVNPDQRTLRTKVEEAIPVVKKAVGEYLEDPKLPTKDQLSEFAKQAGQSAVESVEDLGDLMFKGKGTLGDVVGLAIGAGTGSIPFNVPEGAIRTFGGATPPTYQKREAPLFSLSTSPDEVLDIYNMGLLIFREPIVEFAKTLDIPKKGLLGSEFLNQVKKNPSIPETSLQESVIEPSRRYTKDELLRALGVGANTQGTFRSVANISPARIKQFERYQRQGRDAGFVGGTEIDYFDIPLDVTIGYPGKKFKAHSQHYQDETLVHVRGSIIDSSVPFSDFYTGPTGEIIIDSTRNFPAFDTIIDDDNFLLVEEIQSDLLTKGYVKPKSPFDAAFSEAIEEYNVNNPVKYQEAYGDISTDIQKIFKELDEEYIFSPELPIQLEPFNSNPFFSPETETAFTNKVFVRGYTTIEELKDYIKSQNTNSNEIWGILSRLESKVPGVSVVNDAPGGKTYTNISLDLDDPAFEDFLETFYESVKGSEIDHEILMHKYEDFIDDYNEVLLKKIKEKGLSKELDLNDLQRLREKYEESGAKGTLSVGLPPIRKNKQAVDEALKVLIAKAAQQGVDKIVIPPAERIAMARGRELKKDKGDRFYRTYVTDLNKSLKELEDNYPVIVYRDVELPYLSKTDVEDGDPFGMMNEPDFTEIDEDGVTLEEIAEIIEPLGDELLPPSKRKKLVKTGNKGTILDISELIDKYKIEQPRQFAKGGVAMNKQMEMAFMQQGGLKDDGMKRDPVSGNPVPNGSMAKEVRDDIPAQLSEGEYVVPADVVRYLGVKHFEDLRTKAKEGLQSMEANGRIGGEPVPVGGPKAMQQPQQMQPPMPQAPTPYSPPPAPMPPQPRQMAMGGDLTPAEMQEINNIMMNQGGMVAGAANGADFSFYKPPEGVSVEEAITTPGRPGGGRYTGEFSFEQPPAPIATVPAPPPVVVETPATCEARGMVYNPETKLCEMPLPVVRADEDDGVEDEGEDSTTWMDSYDYTDFNNLAQQTSAALDGPTTMLGSAAEFIFGGGVLGKFAKASNAAQVAANIAILEAQGKDVDALKVKFNNYVNSNNLDKLKPFITGKNLAKQINKTQVDVGLFRDSKDVFGNDIFKSDDDFNKQLQDNAPAGMVYTPDQGAYIRSPGVSAAPSTSIRPEGGFAAAKAAATPVTAVPKKNDEPSATSNTRREPRDDDYSASDMMRDMQSRQAQAASVSTSEGVSAPTSGGARSVSTPTGNVETYASKVKRGGGFSKGGLASKPKKKK